MRYTAKTSMIYPDSFLSKIPADQRRQLFPGTAGMTRHEAIAASIARDEKELQRQIEQLLLRHGIRVTRQRMDRKSNIAVGNPDISFSCRGRAIYWEIKMPGRRPDPDQIRAMAELSSPPNSAIVRVITSYIDAYDELQRLLAMSDIVSDKTFDDEPTGPRISPSAN